MSTLRGETQPTSQTPLLQAKFEVISVGVLVVAAVADPAAARIAKSSEGARMAAARHSLDGMMSLPMFGLSVQVVGEMNGTGRRRTLTKRAQ